ncbi:MAG: hypothetical protein NTV46_11920 [Verrucomicrobia bacterium]|nr:hypothetical protein [Verrucomicrobiota bacterium]
MNFHEFSESISRLPDPVILIELLANDSSGLNRRPSPMPAR